MSSLGTKCFPRLFLCVPSLYMPVVPATAAGDTLHSHPAVDDGGTNDHHCPQKKKEEWKYSDISLLFSRLSPRLECKSETVLRESPRTEDLSPNLEKFSYAFIRFVIYELLFLSYLAFFSSCSIFFFFFLRSVGKLCCAWLCLAFCLSLGT